MTRNYRTALVAGAALTALAAGAFGPAAAQETAGGQVEEVTVTASRVVRDGYEAPTPTTVVGIDQIQKAAPTNIADFVNQLPSLAGSYTPRVDNTNTSGGTTGINRLDLRGLGSNRTLVLLDGRRIVPSVITGVADINNVPSALVERVEIVTGGASAAWGSDAVAGVVNFVLDSKFTGVKGSVQGGITQRQDNGQGSFSLSAGTPFAGGRGHVLVSGEAAYVSGVDGLDPNKRKWYSGTKLYINPAYSPGNGQPQQIVRQNEHISNAAPGGLILSGVARGTQFGPGGVPQPFVFGTEIFDPFMVGGSNVNQDTEAGLEAETKRGAFWGRASYQLTDTIEGALEGSYGKSYAQGSAVTQRFYGNLTMRTDNAFLDPTIAARMRAAGETTFRFGTFNSSQAKPVNKIDRESGRIVAALKGRISEWDWDAYYQHGVSKNHRELHNDLIPANYRLAIDAVRSPTSGSIVCRSTLTNPNDGCVPLNPFGTGMRTEAGTAYSYGIAWADEKFQQDVASFTITGEPLTIPAGAISLAAGAEYRKEQVSGRVDARSLVSGWQAGNYKPTFGSYDVREAFFETVVPLLRDMPLAQTLEFNGSARYTSYSTAGEVTTWKLGLSWTPVEDIRFRLVRSRDIRAPNLDDLFQAGTGGITTINDPFNGNVNVQYRNEITGNQDLVPENADTLSVGVVVQPRWLPQLRGSIDVYDIKISDSISRIPTLERLQRCFAGETRLCADFIRDANNQLVVIRDKPINVAEERAQGMDIEVSYRQALDDWFDGWNATLTIRALGTHVEERSTTINNVYRNIEGENSGAVANWRWLGVMTYDQGPASVSLTLRTISEGVYDNRYVEGVDIDTNYIPGREYFDLSGSYRFGGDDSRRYEAFFKVDNLLDRDPPLIGVTTPQTLGVNPMLFDSIGRSYRAGLRFSF